MSNERRPRAGDFLWEAIGRGRDVPPSAEEFAGMIEPLWVDFVSETADQTSRSIAALEAVWMIGGQVAHQVAAHGLDGEGKSKEPIPLPMWALLQIATAYMRYRNGDAKSMDEAFGFKGKGRGGGGRPIDRHLRRTEQLNRAADAGALVGGGTARSINAAVGMIAQAEGIEPSAIQKIVAKKPAAVSVGKREGDKSRLNSKE